MSFRDRRQCKLGYYYVVYGAVSARLSNERRFTLVLDVGYAESVPLKWCAEESARQSCKCAAQFCVEPLVEGLCCVCVVVLLALSPGTLWRVVPADVGEVLCSGLYSDPSCSARLVNAAGVEESCQC